jgi:hypothetical protein
MPAAPNVRYAHTAPPVNGTDNQLPAAAAYYPGEDTVYFGGNLDRFTRGHELGHAFDDQVLSDGDRGEHDAPHADEGLLESGDRPFRRRAVPVGDLRGLVRQRRGRQRSAPKVE